MHRFPVLPGEGAFVPTGPGDLAFQKWLQESQWWPHERMLSHQLELLGRLANHAHDTVALQRSRIDAAGIDPDAPLTLSDWRRLPILTRKDLQRVGEGLASSSVPAEHGTVIVNTSSGSTGAPVSVQGTLFDA